MVDGYSTGGWDGTRVDKLVRGRWRWCINKGVKEVVIKGVLCS
jgi:hypothetical protein